MPEDQLLPPLEYFRTQLDLDEQVSLLRDPEQALSFSLTEKLSRNVLVISEPAGLTLAPTLIGQLTGIRGRLDVWWKRLDPDDQAYIIENRNGEFDVKEYAGLVHGAGLASSAEGSLAGVVSDGVTNQFRLPPMIRVYVEMKATEPSS